MDTGQQVDCTGSAPSVSSMRYRLISCRVLEREMAAAIARSPNDVDIEYLPKGLHDLPSREMRQCLQTTLDGTGEEQYDAVLFGYGLCNNGLDGLTAGKQPIVVPRAHDCITLFLGSKERYLDYFQQNPGTYFLTSGWIEHGEVTGELRQLTIQHAAGMDKRLEELVAHYGEDNARFLYDTLCAADRHYGQYTFIEMGVEPDNRFEQIARERAATRGWTYKRIQGSMSLLQRLVDGDWTQGAFLVVAPGWRVKADYSEGIITAVPAGRPPGAS